MAARAAVRPVGQSRRLVPPRACPGRPVCAGRGGAARPLTPRAAYRGELRSLTLLTLAGLAACFLTPFHYHTFAWPVPLGLSHAEQAWMRDPLGQGLVVSPFVGRLAAASAFASVGGWAYCLLLAAGAASFVLRGKALHPGRLLVWLALAALSAYQARAIPFFAVAAGPILALNLQEWSRAAVARGCRRRLAAALRGADRWPGWPCWSRPGPAGCNPRPTSRAAGRSSRRKPWSGWPGASTSGIRSTRSASDRCALTFSPEVAHYLAWFCPSEKGFLDSRWPLFDRTADDFVQMRRCLLQPDGSGPAGRTGAFAGRPPDRSDPSVRSGRETNAPGLSLPAAGRTGMGVARRPGRRRRVFGRRSGGVGRGRKPPRRWKALDLRQAAYHPDGGSPVRRRPPRPCPNRRGFSTLSAAPRNEHSADRGEAALYLVVFDLAAEQQRQEMATQWLLAQATGLVGSGLGSEPAGTASALAVRLHLAPLLPGGLGAGRAANRRRRSPPGSWRRTIAARPRRCCWPCEPPGGRWPPIPTTPAPSCCWGKPMFAWPSQTREQSWQAVLPALAAARHAQALTALEQAVALRPDLDRAHALLAQLYYEDNQLDRALDHLRARLRIAEQEVAAHGPEAASAADRCVALAADVDTMESLVEQAEKIYEANTADKTDPSKVFDGPAWRPVTA